MEHLGRSRCLEKPSRTGYSEILCDQSTMRNESRRVQHRRRHAGYHGCRPTRASVTSSSVRRGCGPNWPFWKASPGGLPSPAAQGVRKQCVQVVAAAEENFADCHGVPSVQEAAHPHFKSGDRDGIFTLWKTGLLSGRG